MLVQWSDDDDSIIAGDLTAGLAYVTPAGCAVVTAVAPVGLRDRERGTIMFTTSLGFGRKLDRIRRNPQVALAYHAREHGFATEERYVLVQGRATFDSAPDRELLEQLVAPAATRFLGAPRRGVFWDRWLREYYAERVIVTVAVERVTSWDNLECCGVPSVAGEALPGEAPAPQLPPANATAARVGVETAARRIGRQAHVLVGFVAADGRPFVVPTTVGPPAEGSLTTVTAEDSLLPPGGRRAGLLAHSFRPELVGLESRVYTGWLDASSSEPGRVRYYPFTESGFRAPANKTLLLLANGYLAKRGAAKARRAAPASPSTG